MNNEIKVNTFENMPKLREIEVETYKDLSQLPMYTITRSGKFYNKQEQLVAVADIKDYALLFPVTSAQKSYIFIEKCTINNKKGVGLYLINTYVQNKNAFPYLCREEPMYYITNDWEMYDSNKHFIEPKERSWKCSNISSISSLQDIRFINLNTLDPYSGKKYPFGRLSPFSTKLLKEQGFDLTVLKTWWQIGQDTIDYNEMFPIASFLECIKHPNKTKFALKTIQKSNLLIYQEKFQNTIREMIKSHDALHIESDQDNVYLLIHHTQSYWRNILLHVYDKKTGNCECFISSCQGKFTNDKTRYKYQTFKNFDSSDVKSFQQIINCIQEHISELQEIHGLNYIFNAMFPNSSFAEILSSYDMKAIYRKNNYYAGGYYNSNSTIGSLICQEILEPLFNPVYYKDMTYESFIKHYGSRYVNELIAARKLYLSTDITNIHTASRIVECLFDINSDVQKTKMYEQCYLSKKNYEDFVKDATIFNKSCVNTNVYNEILYYLINILKGTMYSRYRNSTDGYNYGGWSTIETRSNTKVLSKKQVAKKYGKYITLAMFKNLILFSQTSNHLSTQELVFNIMTYYNIIVPDNGFSDSEIIRILNKISATNITQSAELYDYYKMKERIKLIPIAFPTSKEDFKNNNLSYVCECVTKHFPQISVSWLKEAILNTDIKMKIHCLHDFMSANYDTFKQIIGAEQSKILNESYKSWKETLQKKFAWSNDKFTILVPEKVEDLSTEGKVLHHCVSSYQEAFASKHTTILFFRRNNNLSEPYFTIELSQNGSINNKFSIRQVHGLYNSNPSAEIVQALLQWAQDTGNVNETSIRSQYAALCCRG